MGTDLFSREVPFHAPPGSRAYVIDDNSEMRQSLHMLLGTFGITTWPFANPIDFLDQIDALPPAPILLDIRMPDLGGVDVMRELAKHKCAWPVIVMTAHGDVTTAVQLMKLGAIEFLEKPFDLDAAVIALDQAYNLLREASLSEASAIEARRRFASLTQREAQVVARLLTGAPNKIVAADLALSIRTVEMYRASALAKLGTHNIVETVALAHCAHWASPETESL